MDNYIDINPQTYDWCVRIFDRINKLLAVNIRMHSAKGQVDAGDIFLFNHFSRMETFIPQYLIYHENGDYCRSVASAEFFKGNNRLTQFLHNVGAVPNDHPHLMSLLARDILIGRKVIMFPEGGMVKDRRVLDDEGRYSVFSRSTMEHRKHHTGAARLAIGLQIFKRAVLKYAKEGNQTILEQWTEGLALPSVDALLLAARKDVRIVPANITFFPLRVKENFLSRGVELFGGELSKRAAEELIVEGNLFLRNTDMDIRLGKTTNVAASWRWWERHLSALLAHKLPNIDAIFSREFLQQTWIRKRISRGLRMSISGLRDRYMHEIYSNVTVNLSHLASHIILMRLEQKRGQIDDALFRRVLYLAIKYLQPHNEVHLHRSLVNPSIYRKLLRQRTSELQDFLDSASSVKLLNIKDDIISFKQKLDLDHTFDEIRLENPIEVYANEARPIAAVTDAVKHALEQADILSATQLARLRFDDELIDLDWCKQLYNKPKHQDINCRETATADPAPFLLTENVTRRLGIVLIHGFLASPAEVRAFGQRLHDQGYPVLGVRLSGHGTSPWDLRSRSWADWYTSVERAYEIIGAYCDNVCMVGFSTGGALALLTAANEEMDIAGVVSICAPIKFRNRNLRFVPLVYGANRVVRWLSSYEGVMPFRPNESEHPNINYRHIPIRGLYELTRLVVALKRRIRDITCPTCIIQASNDHVVEPSSAQIAYDKLRVIDKELHWVESNKHGILNGCIGNTEEIALNFVAHIDQIENPVENSDISAQ